MKPEAQPAIGLGGERRLGQAFGQFDFEFHGEWSLFQQCAVADMQRYPQPVPSVV
ncbi:MAG: hypothetical protein RIT16_1012 [Actinomycetota bacterium]